MTGAIVRPKKTREMHNDHMDSTICGADSFWKGGARTFINEGANGRWKATLTAAANAGHGRRAIEELGPERAQWMMTEEKQPK